MIQANPNLIGNPDSIKAILTLSAYKDALSSYGGAAGDNYTFNGNKISGTRKFLSGGAGAGILNIPAAIRTANSNLFYSYTLLPETSEKPVTESYCFAAGTTVDFSLVFEKNNNEIIKASSEDETISETLINQNNLEIQILDSSNNVVFSSVDEKNNVNVFRCTFTQAGKYKFRIYFENTIKGDYPLNASIAFSCSCAEKMISHSNFAEDKHTVSCANSACGFSCKEKHRVAQVTKTTSYDVEVTFSIYYLPRKYYKESTNAFDYLGQIQVSYESQRDDITVHTAILSYANTENTPTGEIISRSYEVVIELPGQTYVFPEVSTTVYIDYWDNTVSIT